MNQLPEKDKMKKMLAKGDQLRHKYEGFDFDRLDFRQKFWLDRLSLFSAHRDFIERINRDEKVSNEMKVIFVEQHSMKINQGQFYDLERKRTAYVRAQEGYPYIGGFLSVFYFIGFAIRTPLHRKLYKETAFSVALGMLTALAYPLYYRKQYLINIDEIYWYLQDGFEKHPELRQIDSPNVIKNFGFSRNISNPDEDHESAEAIEADIQQTIMDGDENSVRKELKQRIMQKA